ncbi:ethanolamine utilization protein EutH [Escherichia coli]
MAATLANNIPMFGMMKQMDTRGKVINCAFSVPPLSRWGST